MSVVVRQRRSACSGCDVVEDRYRVVRNGFDDPVLCVLRDDLAQEEGQEVSCAPRDVEARVRQGFIVVAWTPIGEYTLHPKLGGATVGLVDVVPHLPTSMHASVGPSGADAMIVLPPRQGDDAHVDSVDDTFGRVTRWEDMPYFCRLQQTWDFVAEVTPQNATAWFATKVAAPLSAHSASGTWRCSDLTRLGHTATKQPLATWTTHWGYVYEYSTISFIVAVYLRSAEDNVTIRAFALHSLNRLVNVGSICGATCIGRVPNSNTLVAATAQHCTDSSSTPLVQLVHAMKDETVSISRNHLSRIDLTSLRQKYLNPATLRMPERNRILMRDWNRNLTAPLTMSPFATNHSLPNSGTTTSNLPSSPLTALIVPQPYDAPFFLNNDLVMAEYPHPSGTPSPIPACGITWDALSWHPGLRCPTYVAGGGTNRFGDGGVRSSYFHKVRAWHGVAHGFLSQGPTHFVHPFGPKIASYDPRNTSNTFGSIFYAGTALPPSAIRLSYFADSCQGDSGGPLTIEHSNLPAPALLAVVSHGYNCGMMPGGMFPVGTAAAALSMLLPANTVRQVSLDALREQGPSEAGEPLLLGWGVELATNAPASGLFEATIRLHLGCASATRADQVQSITVTLPPTLAVESASALPEWGVRLVMEDDDNRRTLSMDLARPECGWPFAAEAVGKLRLRRVQPSGPATTNPPLPVVATREDGTVVWRAGLRMTANDASLALRESGGFAIHGSLASIPLQLRSVQLVGSAPHHPSFPFPGKPLLGSASKMVGSPISQPLRPDGMPVAHDLPNTAEQVAYTTWAERFDGPFSIFPFSLSLSSTAAFRFLANTMTCIQRKDEKGRDIVDFRYRTALTLMFGFQGGEVWGVDQVGLVAPMVTLGHSGPRLSSALQWPVSSVQPMPAPGTPVGALLPQSLEAHFSAHEGWGGWGADSALDGAHATYEFNGQLWAHINELPPPTRYIAPEGLDAKSFTWATPLPTTLGWHRVATPKVSPPAQPAMDIALGTFLLADRERGDVALINARDQQAASLWIVFDPSAPPQKVVSKKAGCTVERHSESTWRLVGDEVETLRLPRTQNTVLFMADRVPTLVVLVDAEGSLSSLRVLPAHPTCSVETHGLYKSGTWRAEEAQSQADIRFGTDSITTVEGELVLGGSLGLLKVGKAGCVLPAGATSVVFPASKNLAPCPASAITEPEAILCAHVPNPEAVLAPRTALVVSAWGLPLAVVNIRVVGGFLIAGADGTLIVDIGRAAWTSSADSEGSRYVVLPNMLPTNANDVLHGSLPDEVLHAGHLVQARAGFPGLERWTAYVRFTADAAHRGTYHPLLPDDTQWAAPVPFASPGITTATFSGLIVLGKLKRTDLDLTGAVTCDPWSQTTFSKLETISLPAIATTHSARAILLPQHHALPASSTLTCHLPHLVEPAAWVGIHTAGFGSALTRDPTTQAARIRFQPTNAALTPFVARCKPGGDGWFRGQSALVFCRDNIPFACASLSSTEAPARIYVDGSGHIVVSSGQTIVAAVERPSLVVRHAAPLLIAGEHPETCVVQSDASVADCTPPLAEAFVATDPSTGVAVVSGSQPSGTPAFTSSNFSLFVDQREQQQWDVPTRVTQKVFECLHHSDLYDFSFQDAQTIICSPRSAGASMNILVVQSSTPPLAVLLDGTAQRTCQVVPLKEAGMWAVCASGADSVRLTDFGTLQRLRILDFWTDVQVFPTEVDAGRMCVFPDAPCVTLEFATDGPSVRSFDIPVRISAGGDREFYHRHAGRDLRWRMVQGGGSGSEDSSVTVAFAESADMLIVRAKAPQLSLYQFANSMRSASGRWAFAGLDVDPALTSVRVYDKDARVTYTLRIERMPAIRTATYAELGLMPLSKTVFNMRNAQGSMYIESMRPLIVNGSPNDAFQEVAWPESSHLWVVRGSEVRHESLCRIQVEPQLPHRTQLMNEKDCSVAVTEL